MVVGRKRNGNCRVRLFCDALIFCALFYFISEPNLNQQNCHKRFFECHSISTAVPWERVNAFFNVSHRFKWLKLFVFFLYFSYDDYRHFCGTIYTCSVTRFFFPLLHPGYLFFQFVSQSRSVSNSCFPFYAKIGFDKCT